MTILFLSDNFPPEYNAPATRTFEHCKEWVKSGATVTVVTCFPNFPKGMVFDGYKNRLYSVEIIDGIKVIRVWSFIAANKGKFKRTVDFVSYSLMAFIFGMFQKCDVVVATSPQFFTAIAGFWIGFFRRKPWIMEVRDLWPESIGAVNMVKSGFALSLLEKLELFLYRNSAKVIVVTDSFKENIVERGISGKKVSVVKNGANLDLFYNRPKDTELLKRLGIEGRFVVGYLGTHGLSHGLDFILNCAAKLASKTIVFVFIGEGAVKEDLKQQAKDIGLETTIFLDSVPKNEVPSFISIFDVALVPLRKSTTFESVIPSKIFEIAASGKPILLGVKGETKKIIESYNAGVCYEPEDEMDFLKKVEYLYHKLSTDGENFNEGCLRISKDFNRSRLASEMLAYIEEVMLEKR